MAVYFTVLSKSVGTERIPIHMSTIMLQSIHVGIR